jgi:hypothetical protein
MYYFFQVLLKFFFKLIIWLELSLFDCVTCLFAKQKSNKKYRFFKRSYIETYFTIIKNKIQIQMSVLFPNIFETKQYVTYPSNRCLIFSTNETNFRCYSDLLGSWNESETETGLMACPCFSCIYVSSMPMLTVKPWQETCE